MYRTALYGRTSKDDPKRVTIEIQQATLRNWATNDGEVTVAAQFWDSDVSGKLPLWERPAGKLLLAEVDAGRVDAVAVAYSDRFGRTLLDGLQAVKLLETKGVKLIAVNDGWDARHSDSPLFFQFRMMMAEEEHRRISARMKAGRLRAIERDNAPPGGALTYGYTNDTRGQYELHPEEAPIVAECFRRCLVGESNHAIARFCIEAGAVAGRRYQKRTPGAAPTIARNHSAAKWDMTRVSRMLRNRIYIGERRWGGRVFPVPPIVDRATFDAVQKRLANYPRHGKPGAHGLCSGLLTCECGGRYYAHSVTCRSPRYRDGSKTYLQYCCSGMREGTCKGKILSVPAIDALVWRTVCDYLADPEALIRRVLASQDGLSGEEADLDAVEARQQAAVEALDAEVAELWSQQRANNWPLAWVTPQLNVLSERRNALLASLAATSGRRATVYLQREQTEEIVAAIGRLRASLANATREDKAEAIRIVVSGGTVKTIGTGRRKLADMTILLRWGALPSVHTADEPRIDPRELSGMYSVSVPLASGTAPE